MDDAHAEDLDRRISELCVRLDVFKETRNTVIKWALTALIGVWLSVIGYVYRIDVAVVQHTGQSASIVNRVDGLFGHMNTRIESLIGRVEKQQDRIEHRLDVLERREYVEED